MTNGNLVFYIPPVKRLTKTMRSNIKDVAQKAGVSTATVSLVLKGHQRISAGTRRKVLKAVEELDYHPSHTARGLVSKQTGNIGFVLTEDHFLRTEPFYTQIFLGAEFSARQFPYYILLTTIPTDSDDDEPLPRFVVERSIDGLIIAGKVPANFICKLMEYKLPLVMIDFFPPSGQYSAVLIDNINGGMQATDHLISCGHKKIAFIGGEMDHPSIRDRYMGYKMALEKKGIEFDPMRIVTTETSTSRDGGYNAMKESLEKIPDTTAVFACNDAMAIGAMQYLKEKKFRIPQDISLIGFDDIESDMLQDPPLTTMRVPKFDMGGEALRLMYDMLKSKQAASRKILMPVELIIRESTCIK